MGQLIGQLGPVGLLTLTVWLVLTGHLVPRSVLRDVQQERDEWRATARDSEDARHEDREQVRDLLEVARVTEHVLTSLPRLEGVRHGTADVDETTPR